MKIIDFLNSIGIRTKYCSYPIKGFLPNVFISAGVLYYTEDTLPSDILHEAGHIAIIPEEYRAFCTGDMEKCVQTIWAKAKAAGELEEIDGYMCRALLQASDVEATAWAWAAGKFLEIPEAEIILDSQYEGNGKNIRFMLSTNSYFGINGLRAARMLKSVREYPVLQKWTQKQNQSIVQDSI